jgi:hypothetical protein
MSRRTLPGSVAVKHTDATLAVIHYLDHQFPSGSIKAADGIRIYPWAIVPIYDCSKIGSYIDAWEETSRSIMKLNFAKLMRAKKSLDDPAPAKQDRSPLLKRLIGTGHDFLAEEAFKSILHLEKKRAERSCASFLLMLLDVGEIAGSHDKELLLLNTAASLCTACREVDTKGWYKKDACVGVIFNGIDEMTDEQVSGRIIAKIHGKIFGVLRNNVGAQVADKVKVSMHVFPQQQVAIESQNGSSFDQPHPVADAPGKLGLPTSTS